MNGNDEPVYVRLRQLANQLELRGDWQEAELLKEAADKMLKLESANNAFVFALREHIIININAKKRRKFFEHGKQND